MSCQTGAIMNLFSGLFQRVNLYENLIESQDVGIGLYLNDGADEIKVRDNVISVHSPSSVGIGGILVGHFGYAGNTTLHNNVISINRAAYGIAVEAADKIQINENQVYLNHLLNNTSVNENGIFVQAAHSAFLQCNQVEGSFIANFPQNGIRIDNSQNWLLSCNSTHNTPYGFRFQGLCKSEENFRGNIMNTHYIGLYLPNVGTGANVTQIGQQTAKGNRWFDNTSGYKSAVCNANAADSYILADENYPNFFPPKYTRILPTGYNWFKHSPIFAFSGCEGEGGECPTEGGEFPIGGEGGLDSLDYKLANESIMDSLYTETSRFRADNYLYKKLTIHPELLPDSGVVRDFYDTQSELNPEKIQAIQSTHVALSQPTINPDYATLRTQLFELWASKTLKDSMFISLTDSGNLVSPAFLVDYQQITRALDSLISTIDSISMLVTTEKETLLSYLTLRNSEIIDSEVAAANEKLLNTIYYATIGLGIFDFDSTQRETVEMLANDCPASGGDAIYKARALQAVLQGDTLYNDTLICALQGIAWRKPYPKEVHSSSLVHPTVSPNPADRELYIHWGTGLADKSKCEVFDMTGKKMSTVEIEKGAKSIILDTRMFPSGIYYYEIAHQKGKFLVIHPQ
jgi:hypothetical protein